MKIQILIYALENRVSLPYQRFQASVVAANFEKNKHNCLIGFVTQILNKSHNIQQINGMSQYGTLMKIQECQNSLINGDTQSNNYSLTGLTFARFKVISVLEHEYGHMAEVEILNDDITKESMMEIQKSSLVEEFKNRLSTFYFQSLNQFEAYEEIKTINIMSIKRLVFNTASMLDLRIEQCLQFLQISDLNSQIQMLTDILIKRTFNLSDRIYEMKEANNQEEELVCLSSKICHLQNEEIPYTYKNKIHYLSIKALDPSFREEYCKKKLHYRSKL